MDPIPAANPMTPEGYIEGFANFARGLKRIFGRPLADNANSAAWRSPSASRGLVQSITRAEARV